MFPEWTSAHGIPLLGRFRSFCFFFWIIVVIVAFGVLIWQIVLTILNFLEYKRAVQQEYAFSLPPFPAITFCDLNPYQRDLAYEHDDVSKFFKYNKNKIVKKSKSVWK